MQATKATRVCVTGGSGFIASWLIKLLLERGYNVRATVRDPENLERTRHLWELSHARERLELVKADLLDEGSFDAAVAGCEGVFHTASPVSFFSENPEEDLIKPAVQGTLNVLTACAKSSCLRRIVLTSSTMAVSQTSEVKPGSVVDERFWSNKEFCKERGLWYPLSKLLAEEIAWAFEKERGLDLVVINPALVVGRPFHQSVDTGSTVIIEAMTGRALTLLNVAFSWVDVEDVSEAHVLAFEVPTASGRYICSEERTMDYPTLQEKLQKLNPGYLFQTRLDQDGQPQHVIQHHVCTNKLKELGLTCRAVDAAMKENMDCLVTRGLL